MPTVRGGPETRQNAPQFKQLLAQAEEALRLRGLRDNQLDSLLGQPRKLAEDSKFWSYQGEGLAMFCAPGFFRQVRSEITFAPLAEVGERFHITPLLAERTGPFLVLVLDLGGIRLLEGRAGEFQELPLDCPTSLREELEPMVAGRDYQHHARRPGTAGSQVSMSYGEKDDKAAIAELLAEVAGAVQKAVTGRQEPLVLAGVDYVVSMYRKDNDYPHLLEATIAADDNLYGNAVEVVKPYFEAPCQQAVERYRELAGTGRASDRLAEILLAAVDGRVETLLVAPGARQRGRFEDREVELTDDPALEDLLDRAVAETLTRGGQAHLVELPEKVAAIYRY